jgi:hypothetical protein
MLLRLSVTELEALESEGPHCASSEPRIDHRQRGSIGTRSLWLRATPVRGPRAALGAPLCGKPP